MDIPGTPLPPDPLPLILNPAAERAIGSPWRRIIALVVDGIIVALPVILVGIPFFEPLSHLGPWGRLVGLCLALPYFAILNSAIGNGQTMGKRWMHLQVVDKDGKTISFRKSVLRYFLFAVPYYLNQIELPITRTPWVVSALVSLVIFGVGGATFYLVLFNRHTRQGIHDLAAGTHVADTRKTGPLSIQPIWKTHWVILCSLLVLLVLGTGALGKKLAKWGSFPQLLEDVRAVEGLEGVQSAGAQDMTNTNFGTGAKQKILVLNVIWTGQSTEESAFADQVARLILQRDPNVHEHDLLRVTMIRGYDLGIAHARVSRFYQHTPEEWNSRLVGN